MLVTLFNWIYIFFICYVIGFFLLPRIAKMIDPDSGLVFNWCDRVIAGLIVSTVYAGLFSLISGVGPAANIILISCCVIFIILDRRSLKSELKSLSLKGFKALPDVPLAIIGLILFVLILMYTAESSFHFDTGLYHAQAIHWIEDYGIIKGLGRLHVRFAYNSAYFPLCALFSLREITGGQSLHSVSGFIFMIMCMYSVYGWIRPSGRSALTVSMRLAPIFYFLVCMLEITSPESDYITINLMIWVFIRLAEISLAESGNDKLAGYCLIAISTFSLVGFKLSAAVIAVVTVWPLVIMIRKKKWKGIIICAVLCALMVIPYLIRNVIICGWLVYPVDMIDLFDVPWKFTKDTLSRDANEIGEWAKSINFKSASGDSPFSWIEFWWSKQDLAPRLFISSVILAAPLMLISLFFRKNHFIKFLMLVLSASLVFYLFKAPLIRYCYGAAILLKMVGYVAGQIASAFGNSAVTMIRLIVSLLKVLVIAALVMYCLFLFGIDPTGLLASAGILSVVVGLGAQNLVGDLLAGIFIILEGTLHVGDYVMIDNVRGKVIEIGLRTTKYEDDNQNIRIICNNEIKSFANMSMKYSVVFYNIPVPYNEDYVRIRKLMNEEFLTIYEEKRFLKAIPTCLGIENFGSSSVDLRVRFMCEESERLMVQRFMHDEIMRILTDNGISIPFNQIDVHMETTLMPEVNNLRNTDQ